MGITFVPEHLQNVGDKDVVYRKLKGDAPKLQLVAARHRDNFSPLVQQFFKITEKVISSSGKTSAA
jgi:hypothetical protein